MARNISPPRARMRQPPAGVASIDRSFALPKLSSRKIGGKIKAGTTTYFGHYVTRKIGGAQVEITVIQRRCDVIRLIDESTHRDGRRDKIERPQTYGEPTFKRSKPSFS